MSVTDLEAERTKAGVGPDDPWPPADDAVDPESVAGRAADGEGEPTDDELFPLGTIEGDEKTIKNLIRGGMPVKVTVSLMSASVPSPRGGLLDPDKQGQLIVSHQPAKYILIPQYEGEPGGKRVTGWEVRQQIRPTYVQTGRMYTREEVLNILHEVGIPSTADRIPELLGE